VADAALEQDRGHHRDAGARHDGRDPASGGADAGGESGVRLQVI